MIIKQEQPKRLRKSDGGIVSMKVRNVSGEKAITTTTAKRGHMHHAQ